MNLLSCSLLNHKSQYRLSFYDALKSCLVSSFALRHFELANKTNETGISWGHRCIALLESIPILGLLLSLIERIAVLVLTKLTGFQTAKQKLAEEKAAKILIEFCKHLPLRNSIPVSANSVQQANQLRKWLAQDHAIKSLTHLDLCGKDLHRLPPEIKFFTHLILLKIDDNHLSSLPSELGCLDNLEELYAFENQLACLPASIGQLKKLKKLYVGSNLLTSLPTEVNNLKNLRTLSLSYNAHLTSIPRDILNHLEVFEIDGCSLKDMPSILTQLSSSCEVLMD